MGAPVRKKDPVATSPYGTPKGARSPLSRYRPCLSLCFPHIIHPGMHDMHAEAHHTTL